MAIYKFKRFSDMTKINSDGLFKELLTTFFVEFWQSFFPEAVEYLALDSLEIIDKEIFAVWKI